MLRVPFLEQQFSNKKLMMFFCRHNGGSGDQPALGNGKFFPGEAVGQYLC